MSTYHISTDLLVSEGELIEKKQVLEKTNMD